MRLKGNRLDYNKSIQKSDSEELLLNIVRIRYSETPYFMQVSSISSSFNHEISLGAEGHFNQGQEMFVQYPSASLIPTFHGTVAETPTITFSPLLGEEFVKQLLADITPSRFWFLHKAGWEMPMLLSLLTRSIGKLYNPDHYQLTDAQALEKRNEFLEFSDFVGELTSRGDFGLLYQTPTEEKPYALIMQFRFKDMDEARRMDALLGAELAKTAIEDGKILGEALFSESIGLPKSFIRREGQVIFPISLRNFIGVLVYLDSGVSVPQSHLDKGVVVKAGKEEIFSAQSRFIRIWHSKTPPADALVSVSHHGVWFYIKDDDFDSKRTFGFVATLLSLQSGKVTGTTPILTLPVGK